MVRSAAPQGDLVARQRLAGSPLPLYEEDVREKANQLFILIFPHD